MGITSNAANEAFSVAGLTAQPGTKVYGTTPALELADGTVMNIPVALVAGEHKGPTAYIGAGIHGDEICSIVAVHQFLESIDPAALSGNIVCVPVQNPLAVSMQHRLPLQLINRSPMDTMPGDPWMCFPGDPAGNAPSRIAATLNALMEPADFAVDMHTPTTGGRYLPFAFLPPEGAVSQESLEMAMAYAPDFILRTDSGAYVMPGTIHVTIAESGRPAIGVEIGEGGRIERGLATDSAAGLLRVLQHRSMLSSAPEALVTPQVMTSMTAVRSERGGFLQCEVPLGAEVSKGELLAVVTDRFGAVVERVFAPHAGPLVRSTTFATIAEGERIAQIAVLA